MWKLAHFGYVIRLTLRLFNGLSLREWRGELRAMVQVLGWPRVYIANVLALLLMLALTLPVAADGTQTIGDLLREYGPDNANVIAVWRASQYAAGWRTWVNEAATWGSSIAQVDPARGWGYVYPGHYGFGVWDCPAQPRVVTGYVPLQWREPNFTPGWNAYHPAAGAFVKTLAELSPVLAGLIMPRQNVPLLYGPSYVGSMQW